MIHLIALPSTSPTLSLNVGKNTPFIRGCTISEFSVEILEVAAVYLRMSTGQSNDLGPIPGGATGAASTGNQGSISDLGVPSPAPDSAHTPR